MTFTMTVISYDQVFTLFLPLQNKFHSYKINSLQFLVTTTEEHNSVFVHLDQVKQLKTFPHTSLSTTLILTRSGRPLFKSKLLQFCSVHRSESSQCKKHFFTCIKCELYFKTMLIITVGISEATAGRDHLAEKQHHL